MSRPVTKTLKAAAFALCLVLVPSLFAFGGETVEELEPAFRRFLETYVGEIRSGNMEYLGTVHPNLPVETRGFFIGVTLDMMKYATDEGLKPTVTCRDMGICKVTWPQPGDSWASQSFLLQNREWRWLDY